MMSHSKIASALCALTILAVGAMTAPSFAADAESTHPTYERITILGWPVYYERSLQTEENGERLYAALRMLEDKLQIVIDRVPADKVAQLKDTKIWISRNTGVGMCYHPSPRWLSEHGRMPEKARSIEIQNIDHFLGWERYQPMFVLHELAHAYHHQVLHHNCPEIQEAYAHAQKEKLYLDAEHYNGVKKPAYGLNNKKEFFSELTEAYYGRNDIFPFNREQLRKYDPVGYKMVERIWEKDSGRARTAAGESQNEAAASARKD